MSISSALNNALSGLTATARASAVVSSNIANAMTPGYGVRQLELTSPTGAGAGGVKVVGVSRLVDPQLVADRRLASASEGFESVKTGFLDDLERILGMPDQTGSLSGKLSDFETALIAASSRPDAQERLDAVMQTARELAEGLNRASNEVQAARSNSEREIGIQVDRLNEALQSVAALNKDIVSAKFKGRETAAFLDERQRLVDEISEMVPVRVIQRKNGGISLFSQGGTVLLDDLPATIEYSVTPFVTPYMSYADGDLSGLTVNGLAVNISSENGRLSGGTLGAQFAIRDELAPEAQSQLDAISRDLIERFADPAVDPTLGATDPGLFTDSGIALDPLNEEGLSERIALNALVDPDQGGDLWRLRAGLNAAGPGDPGDATLLQALSDTLAERRMPSSGEFGSGFYSALELTAGFQSQIGADRIVGDQKLTFASAQLTEFRQLELESGVDSDAELQRLLLLEQSYAANARVIEAADEMIQRLLGI